MEQSLAKIFLQVIEIVIDPTLKYFSIQIYTILDTESWKGLCIYTLIASSPSSKRRKTENLKPVASLINAQNLKEKTELFGLKLVSCLEIYFSPTPDRFIPCFTRERYFCLWLGKDKLNETCDITKLPRGVCDLVMRQLLWWNSNHYVKHL